MHLRELVVLGLQLSIALTVFGFGLNATADDVLYVMRRPALLARSLVAMFVVMPVCAVILVTVGAFHPAVEIALVALAISPVPPLLPRREVKAGGRASYALGLMATAALLSMVYIPHVVPLIDRLSGEPLATAPGAVARLALVSVVVPLAAGMAVRALARAPADRVRKPVALVAGVLLVLSVLAFLPAAVPAALALVGNGTVAVFVAFVLVGLAVGHALGGHDRNDRIVLAVSTACRHPAIALAIAGAAHPEPRLAMGAILLYLVLNVLVSIPYTRWRG